MIRNSLIILFLPFMISAQSAFIAGDETICNNDEADISVDFISPSPPYSFVYAINGVNQDQVTTDENPYHIKTKLEGVYTLSYFSDAINSGSTNGSALVTVLGSPVPTALFSTDSDTMSILQTTLKLQDLSEGNIVDWQWDFGDGKKSSQQHPFHSYQQALGIYQVGLIVTDNMGCSDTITKNIWITDSYWMYIPNSFTPDYDGLNDKFCIEYHGVREESFLIKIFNFQSDLIYQSINPANLRCSANGWDGNHFITKESLPSDSYIYEIYFQDFEGWKHKEYGSIILIR